MNRQARRRGRLLAPSCSNPRITTRISADRLLKELAADGVSVSNFNVQYLQESGQGKRVKFVTALIFFVTGITVACALLHTPYDFKSVRQIASTASPLIFLIAGVRVFYSGRSGYILGLVAALAGLSWFVGLERVLRRNLTNTWIVFNLPDEGLHGTRDTIAFAEWRVVAVALLIVAFACSALRFLPRDWKLATTSISQRTWPAIAFSLSLLAAWYAASVSPYRIPYIVDAGWPDVTILHVEKRGLRFREIGVSIRRDMGFRVGRNERKWFQYRFLRRGVRGTAPENLHPQVAALLNSPELAILRTLLALNRCAGGMMKAGTS
jgi:hypothetical protein